MGSTVQDPRFARGVGRYRDRGQEAVRVWVEIMKDGGDIEAVHEEGRAAGAIGVLEQVEELESAGVRLRDTRLDERQRGTECGMGKHAQSKLCLCGRAMPCLCTPCRPELGRR